MSFFRSLKSESRQRRKEESRQRFTYRPLMNSKDIRLLKVAPGYNGKIRQDGPGLSIEHVRLTASPLYTAVSYKWGSPGERTDIVIDNHALGVRNLQPMIEALSSPTQSRYFWIDAICINQEDNKERSEQVMQMGEIYAKANEVIAYVSGKNHSGYTTAYQAGRSRRSLSLYSTVANIHHAATSSGAGDWQHGPNAELFFENDYFKRRWIIQEIGLARSVIIHCDGYEFPMGMLTQYFDRPPASQVRSSAARLCQLRGEIAKKMSPLESLLYNNEHAMCSNPRDRIYALLSLTSTARHHLPVDYNVQLPDLLLSVIQVCCTYEGIPPSRVLSFACFLRRQLSISSGVLESAIRDQITFRDSEVDRNTCVKVNVRSVLKSLRINPHAEDYIHKLRSSLPSIHHYPNVFLEESSDYDEATLQIREPPYSEENDLRITRVQSSNQWAFSFKPINSGTAPPPYAQDILAGVSSGAIEPNDEVWQFPRTPVAIIARKTDRGYKLVARALVMKMDRGRVITIKRHSGDGDPGGGRTLERILDWP